MRKRIKEICDYVSRGCAPNYVDESPYAVMNQATFSKGFIDRDKIRYSSKNPSDALICKGDLLMASTGGGVLGKVFYFDLEDLNFYADSHVSILRNSKGKNDMKFLYYYFSTKYEEINATMVKGSTNQTELQRNYLLMHTVDIPSIEKQKKIVAYLDKQVNLINIRICLRERELQLLNELKRSEIDSVVTRGLDPDMPMKDSGIDWIGQIPAHWKIRRLKEVGNLQLGKMLKNDPGPGEQLKPYLKSKNIQWLKLDLTNVEEMWFSLHEINRLKLRKGDILYSEGGEVGKCAMWKEELDECYIQNSVHKFTPAKGIDGRFILYLSFCMGRSGYFDSIVNLVSIKHLTFEKLRRVELPIPPLSEQKEIADYLDNKLKSIDIILDNINTQIEKLKLLKKALINEVITGRRPIQ
ncbi:MAG: restriction endonuclease subunit S [Candidatus Cryptobacteroides sp.]|jgi:type I restriction enzyme S subunit